MIYFLRKKDGSLEKESSGTLVESNGISRHLDLSEIRIRTLRYWTSAKTGGRYPAGWQIDISSADLSVRLEPLLPDQELTTPGSTGVNYYEGAVTGKGLSKQKPVTCEGYIEMTAMREASEVCFENEIIFDQAPSKACSGRRRRSGQPRFHSQKEQRQAL
jgi:predicted secreted hydrolase